MAEKLTIFTGKSIDYSGLFELKEVYKRVVDYLDERGYGPYDASHSEEVYDEGKQILITIKGEKKISDGAKVQWESKFTFTNCLPQVVEEDGVTREVFKGSLSLESEALLVTNYDKTFHQNAFWYFLKVLFDKYVFQSYHKRAQSTAKKDYSGMESLLKNYLNLEKYK